jgi:hypothetical protein
LLLELLGSYQALNVPGADPDQEARNKIDKVKLTTMVKALRTALAFRCSSGGSSRLTGFDRSGRKRPH